MLCKVTILCENSVFHKLDAVAEHGFSAFVETEAGNFLFDTGQGMAIINNARVFKKDLSNLDGIILSHHHADHTGGLLSVLKETDSIGVYVHPELFKKSYSTRFNSPRYIGIPFRRAVLESTGASFVFNRDFTEIASNVYLTGEVPRVKEFEFGDKNQRIKDGNNYVKDTLLDDQSLIIDTDKGLVIVLGCAHAGIINVLTHAVNKTGKSKIHAVIGGTHLGAVSEEQRVASIEALKDFDIDRLGVSHCTGNLASALLYQEFKDHFFFCNTGDVVEVD